MVDHCQMHACIRSFVLDGLTDSRTHGVNAGTPTNVFNCKKSSTKAFQGHLLYGKVPYRLLTVISPSSFH